MSILEKQSFNRKKLHKLLKRYSKGLTSQVENAFIDAYDNWFDNKQNYYLNLPKEEQDELVDRMLDSIHSRIKETKVVPIKPIIKKLTAVAAIFIFATVIIWRIYSDKILSVQITQNESLKVDIPPGYNGAVLTLSDGSKIVLDSTSKTATLYDGKYRIIKRNGVLSYNGNGLAGKYNTVSTPVGRQWKLYLPDGTKAILNAASSIRYPLAFSSQKREVRITGEVYFEVKHEVNNPFIVKTAKQTIKDLGTIFNVNAYQDEPYVKTTLVEGSVSVTSENRKTPLLLQPGQQAKTDNEGNTELIKNANIEGVVDWTNGIFSFKDADIHSIMRQAARWYNLKVEYAAAVPHRIFTGEVMRNANLSDLLKILETSGIHFEINGNSITVKP